MWWLIASTPDFWGRDLGFESGISHNNPGAVLDHFVILGRGENLHLRPKNTLNK